MRAEATFISFQSADRFVKSRPKNYVRKWELVFFFYQLILIGGHGREDGLGEDVGAVELLLEVDDGPGGVLGPDD